MDTWTTTNTSDGYLQKAVHTISTATPTDTSLKLACSIAREYHTSSNAASHYPPETVAASCYYCAAKLAGQPLHPADVIAVDIISADENTILDIAQDVATVLDITPDKFSNSTPYVARYCTLLDLPTTVCQRAEHIVTTLADAPESSGRSPTGWAAAAVYTAAVNTDNVSISQREIATAAHVSPVTVRTSHHLQERLLTKK